MQGGDTMAMIKCDLAVYLNGRYLLFYAVSSSETRTTKTSENA